MKILQLNAWGGRLEKQILELLTKERPDIVCLQEAVSLPGGDNGGFFLTVETMAEELGMHLSYSASIGFGFMSRTAEFGNAILSHTPFVSEHTLFTRMRYVKDFDFSRDDYNVRNLQHVTVEHDGEAINILTHHGHHVQSHKNGDDETMRQCRLIADYVRNLDGKTILTGDFNLSPHSESLEQINAVLKNLSIEAKLDTTRTQLTHKTEVCDYIFVSKGVNVKSFRALNDLASDHQALVMEFS